MKVLAVVTALALGVGVAHAASPESVLIWSDEFNGHALDSTKWLIARDCRDGGVQQRQCYTDAAANVAVSGGALCITARQEPVRGLARQPEQGASEIVSRDYTSARIETRGLASFRYGRIEVRARLPMGQGLRSAIWMLPEPDGESPQVGEIDIAEAVDLGLRCKGCRDEVLGSVRAGAGLEPIGSAQGMAPIEPDDFHVFVLEWTPKRMTWLVDGRPYLSRPKTGPFDQSFHLVLNLAVGGRRSESVGAGGVDDHALPATLMVDWVRVYGAGQASSASPYSSRR